ncbi:MAG: PfkB family carbohydrate kinase, partial [Microlunatus sp.]|nr:PfkB family carbohydrate kinase [Microlunatus sp.]
APGGCPPEVYRPLVKAAVTAGLPVVLDTAGDWLAAGLTGSPTVVKPNREELSALVGTELGDLGSVVAAARELCGRGPRWVVVSLGADGAVAVNATSAVQVSAPRVRAVNPVGCGDVLVGGLASGLARGGLDVAAALPRAVQIAAASAAHPETGVFDPTYADTLTVGITEL